MALTTSKRLALAFSLCFMIAGNVPCAFGQTAEPASSAVPADPATTAPPVVEAAPPTPKPSKALPPMAQVKELYGRGNCKEALNVLATMKPSDETHYWTGLCFQKQLQNKRAAQEFNWLAHYARDPEMRSQWLAATSMVPEPNTILTGRMIGRTNRQRKLAKAKNAGSA